METLELTNNLARELIWSYRFRVMDIYDGYTLANRNIPGSIYVIDRNEADPEGGVDNALIHYSESLRAVMKIVRDHEDVIEETRLVGIDE